MNRWLISLLAALGTTLLIVNILILQQLQFQNHYVQHLIDKEAAADAASKRFFDFKPLQRTGKSY